MDTKMYLLRTTFVVVVLCFLSNVDAFWRMNCAIIHRGRIDPLVSFGAIAGHTHTIIGGSNIGISATADSLTNSACTSCEIQADKSAYWTPTLFYQFENGSFLEVPHNGGVVYYLGRGPNRNKIVPFPKGLNILSGDSAARSFDSDTYTWGNAQYPGRPVAERVSFACLDRTTGGEKHHLWKTDCSDGMRAQIHFQSCWNGKDLYKADNSHVAYLSAIDNGICPPTHPIQIPHLFFETLYSVNNVRKEAGGRFVFSQGDTTGYGFHGDFANGWDLPVLEQAVEECLSVSNFGTIEECAILKASQTSGASSNCPERRPQIDEVVTGLLPKLPGCIEVTEGPERAPGSAMSCGPDVVKPKVASTIDSMPQKTNTPKAVGDPFGISLQQKYVGCFNDSAASIRALNAASMDSNSMTVDYCQQWCQSKGYRLSGVEYSKECKCDNAMNPTIVANEAQCTWLCAGTLAKGGDQQICGGYGYISIYNNTDPSFNANGDMKNSAGGASAPKGLKPLPSNYVGCATDGRNNLRILTSKSTSQVSMSAASCRSFCAQGDGHQYYGTEYGSECFCGNFLQTPNFVTDLRSNPTNATCNMRCTGAGDEMCGGPNALSLYKEPSFVAPTIMSQVGKYVSQNCITDNPANRTLKGAATASNNMTVEMCSTFCSRRKMKYFGVEYGKECFCDNSIRIPNLKARTCDPKNLMLCAGNRKQYCGGSGFMNLYYASRL